MPAAASDAAARALARAWTRAWNGVGAGVGGSAVHERLLAAYGERQRKYHTLQHLRECFELFTLVEERAVHPSEVALALWFHDAVYDVHRSDNEARSAAWAVDALRDGGADAAVAERVHALVMATRHRALPTQPDERLLVDIDLAILGATPRRFAQYERQIRAEYGHVAAPLFASRRRAILRAFLDREHLYATPHLRARFEAPARANLERSLTASVP